MDWDQVEARWKQARGKVRQKWVRLTEDDLKVIAGRRERLESKLHERYGFTTDHVRKEIEDWVRCHLAASPRRSSRKTKLPLPRIRRRRHIADGSVTAIATPQHRGSQTASCDVAKSSRGD